MPVGQPGSLENADTSILCVSGTAGRLLAPALAAVDLVTLPRREGTQLTIYNSEDITMVREHRLLTVKPGVNRIQFSWANTLIDPTSIDFRILDQQDKVDLVDTTFPAGRNDALQWNIQSQMAGKIAVEIRYFTSGITWSADYVGIANEDETKLQPDGLRPRDEQLGRTLRQRPDAAGGGHDQPRGEDRRLGEKAAAGSMDRESDAGSGEAYGLRTGQGSPSSTGDKRLDGDAGRRRRDTSTSRSRSSSRASPSTSSSPSKAARTSATRSPSGWWP